ncbi:MAG: zinc ABC transporter substrate-binding protein [Candidatus Omnitrophica bacterium]|nr:zinc ABC transporter substrate-binding protein [Candidatus Omnitrophota bacterium]MDE2008918.1 zinc ABC transporter substrate-binding protein [Candidatus Omnitrophota bacterium]MDE2213519.1 zinc ABC transporter substrate-binding protein [Candidatus Omnitrophota bacterium]MDE2230580.1 zinc ABC transporter substrate-binding protein [Candidatus Omnitrophota bacterium]
MLNSRIIFISISVFIFSVLCGPLTGHCRVTGNSTKVIQIVAAENFWGSLISQLGGDKVRVFSVVSDPNADPHEYESNAGDARSVSTADYVIENGAGYDSWMDKLLNAGGNPRRKVLNVANFLGVKEGENPHLWYNPSFVNRVTAQMEKDLISIDPNDAGYYERQYKALQSSLAQYQNRIVFIKEKFGGAKVASTESIFVYLADAADLDCISPPAFIDAVAEGNDPPARSVIEFEDQLKSGQVKVLVYNAQTVTPLTENIKKLAADEGIPVMGVTETIQPPDLTFQEWMNAQLISLQNALNAKALGQ